MIKKRRCNNHDAPSNNLTKIKQTNKGYVYSKEFHSNFLRNNILLIEYSTNIKMFNKKTK